MVAWLIVATRVTPANGVDVAVAFVSGTLLATAISRPKVQRGSESTQRWIEVAFTAFAFFVSGYVTAILLTLLAHHVDKQARLSLKGAVFLLAMYALAIHYEPFGATRRGLLTYLGTVIGSACLGFAVGDSLTLWGDPWMWVTAAVGGCLLGATAIAIHRESRRLG